MQLVYLAGILAYAAQGTTALVDERWFVVSVAVGWLVIVTAINFVGLGVGKWLPNVGAVCTAVTAALIVGAGVLAFRSGAATAPVTSPSTSPADIFSGLSVMCFAFIGVELASTMGSEIKRPERDLPRATLAAGVVALGVYIAVTWALQQLLPRSDIGAIQGILQGVDLGARRLHLEWLATPLAVVMAVALAGGLAGWYAGAARIPFTAGVNGALPHALSRVHTRFGSPWVALAVQGLLTLLFIAATMWGATVREAYQVLLKSSVITTLVPFGYMFLGAARLRDEPLWKRAACGVGLAVSGAGIVSAFVPGGDVTSVASYEVKLLIGSILPLAVGLAFYARERRRP
jgi:amino acid transporter